MNWHTKSIDDVLKHFGVNPVIGLNDSQVKKMRHLYGENTIISKKAKPDWILFLEQFNNPIIYILIVAAILNAVISDLKDTLVIAAVVILNTLIGFFQERRASDALKALTKLASPIARVIRNDDQILIPAAEVVCGDTILLESGMKVPADARLIESNNLLIDESMLTGESFSVLKKHNILTEKDASIGDRLNTVYSGTIIHKGRGTAIVTSIGNKTEFGKIAEQLTEAEETVSPLQAQIDKFGKTLSISIISTVAAIFIIGFLRGNHWVSMLLTSVGLAVSAIPEGLPVAVTITLSIGISQMAKRKAVVRKLSAVETLGSTNVICTDKTGTLTKNQMTVTHLYAGGNFYEVTGSGYEKKGIIINKKTKMVVSADDDNILKLTGWLGLTCTESTIVDHGLDWRITGDPTEAALMINSKKIGIGELSANVSIDIPFESEIQLMAVRTEIENKKYIFVKGAPEKIIACCNKMIDNTETSDINIEKLNEVITQFSGNGLRVLALAFTEDISGHQLTLDRLKNLTFLGFAGIEDTVRTEAVDAVNECKNAGIKVVMITGDHIKTAQSVARAVGIGSENSLPVAITGREIDLLTDEELFRKVPFIDVYARVAPHHKLRIVKQLQANRNIVSMTGDGVNDAPALKQADIGVSMGSGTDVARDASHMVLMDDNFATIVHAVRRGRIILHNLQHIMLYILSTCLGGLLTIAASVLAGFPLPMLPAQLLWINLVTDGTSTFPLAFEKEHGDVMVFPPRKMNTPLVSRKMWFRIIYAGFMMMLGTLITFYFYLDNFHSPSPGSLSKARTVAFCMLAFFQIWNVQNSRSVNRSLLFDLPFAKYHSLDKIGPSKNPILLAVMLLAIFLQLGAVTIPFMQVLMNTVPLNSTDWLIIIAVSFSIIIFVEAEKFIRAFILKLGRLKKGIEMDKEAIL